MSLQLLPRCNLTPAIPCLASFPKFFLPLGGIGRQATLVPSCDSSDTWFSLTSRKEPFPGSCHTAALLTCLPVNHFVSLCPRLGSRTQSARVCCTCCPGLVTLIPTWSLSMASAPTGRQLSALRAHVTLLDQSAKDPQGASPQYLLSLQAPVPIHLPEQLALLGPGPPGPPESSFTQPS